MNNQNFYIDLHVIQTVPPSCVNRDDTGSPKTARYGGVTRARVSSQAWKRAMRMMFQETFAEDKLGLRTKQIVGRVAEEILAQDDSVSEDKAIKQAQKALENAGLKIKSAEKGTDALFFLSITQAKALAELVAKGEKDKKLYSAALKAAPSFDMALFGRMVASDPALNWDASAQVAHSISTHEVHNEFDYFTAVDDCMPEDNAGAGHVGTAEFNSSTLYRYATVNVKELYGQLGEDTPAVVRGFAEAFICSMPTGKQNSFANRTLPDAVYVTIRKDQPMNLVNAFEEPVWSEGGYVKKSAQKLAEYAQKIYKRYSAQPEQAFLMGDGLEALGEESSLPEILDKLEAAAREVQ